MDRRLHPTFLTLLRAALCLALLAGAASARAESVSERLQRLVDSARGEDPGYLHPDEAFRFQAQAAGPDAILLSWQIADGYYLYRDKFSFSVAEGSAVVNRAAVQLPRGETREDEVFGTVEVNTGEVEILLPMLREAGAAQPVTLEVGYQGCKEKSICYPPIRRVVSLVLAAGGPSPGAAPGQPNADGGGLAQQLGRAGFAANVLAFLGFGLLLAFTPCVFPLIPILSGILVGSRTPVTPLRGLLLSGAYVLAMALTYALFGFIVGSFHLNLQAAAQAPWAITLFSTVFVVLALSMFGFFELQVPATIQARLGSLGGGRGSGTVPAAASMGALSALIVGPCVASPLAAALLYISQTGDAVLGGAVLFAMAVGFGLPLLLIGISAGGILPRAGPWMKRIKHFFGVLMLGVAIWFMGRILPGPATLVLWGLLFTVCAVFLGALDPLPGAMPWQRFGKGVGLALLTYGVLLIAGAVSGGDNALRPLEPLTRGAAKASGQDLFRPVANLDALRAELQRAGSEGRPVVLDFYADWCVTCKEMDRHTFPDPEVRALLSRAVLLQADVTHYDAAARELLEAFNVPGPPAILFFDARAREQADYRLIGFIRPEQFIPHLRGALARVSQTRS